MKLYTIEDIKQMKSISSARKKLLAQAQEIEISITREIIEKGQGRGYTEHETSVLHLSNAFAAVSSSRTIKLLGYTIEDVLNIARNAAQMRKINLI